jgi:peroxiredoxin Q/BCP
MDVKSLEGQKAPAFSLEGNDGKKHSLEDYQGKTVVLYFYPKDDTQGVPRKLAVFATWGQC